MPLLWASGAAAAAVLVLGVNGTLSAWTTAIIGNNDNTVASATAVALVETQTSPTNATVCDTAAATDGSNTVTCAGINKYGGIGDATAVADNLMAADANGTPLTPGDTQAVTVNMKNDGTGSGTLTLAVGSCSNQVYPGSTGADTADYPLCGEMQLAVACTGTSPFTYSGTVGGFTGGTIGTLDATDSTDCTFTVTLPAHAASGYSSQYVTQDLTWTLSA